MSVIRTRIFHWPGLVIGVVCLLLLAVINSDILQIDALRRVSIHAQFGLLVAGVLILARGLSRNRIHTRRLSQSGLLVAITLLGFALRVWNLENAVHFYVDEGNFVEGILTLWEQPNTLLLSPFNFIAAFTWVFPYMQAGSVAIFGPNLLALRLVSAVFGTLTLPAVYRLGRALFDHKTALLAAFMLAVFPPHIHFSRLGLNNIADPLFGTLALAFLARAMQRGHWSDYGLAGVMLGLTQYFYEGGRLLYPALALVWALLAWRVWRAQFSGLLFAGFTAALVAFPVYFTLAAWEISFTSRLSNRGLNLGYWGGLLLSTAEDGRLLGHLREQVLPPLLHFVSLPDKSAFYYGGHTALVLPPLVPVLLAGILAALRRRGIAGLLLVLWLVFTALGNSLIMQNAWTARYVVAFPPLALLLAVGLRAVWGWLKNLTPKSPLHQIERGLPQFPLMLLLLLLGLAHVVYYFGPHLTAYQTQIRPQHDQQDIVWRVRDLPPDTQVYLITDDDDIYLPVLVFLSRFWGMSDFAPAIRHPTRLNDWEALDNVWWGVGHAFFVEQGDIQTQTYLREKFGFEDEGHLSPYPVPLEKQFLMLYYAPSPPTG